MSQTPTPQVLPSSYLAETQLIKTRDLHPNSWNVNKLNAFQYGKLHESIKEFGFIDPLIARPCPAHPDFEIVGGEHRWKVASEQGFKELPVIVRQMTDQVAKRISLIDNELHGQADPGDLRDLLKDLSNDIGPDMLVGLPFTEDILKGLLGSGATDALSEAPGVDPPPSPRPEGDPPAERFVERTYRMPASIAEVLDDAMNKARQTMGPEAKDFEVLEVLAAEYLAS